MSSIQNLSRRDFLKNSGITGAMVLGAQVVPSSLIAGGAGAVDGRLGTAQSLRFHR